jgi:hypothetical protein
VLVRIFITVINTFSEERFILALILISEVSVCGWLAPLFLCHGETKHYGGRMWGEHSCSPYGGQEAQRRKTGRGQGKIQFPRPGPPSKISNTSSNSSTPWGPSLQHVNLWGREPLGIFSYSNHNRCIS